MSIPAFQAGYDINTIEEVEAGVKWKVTGTIIDNTPLGFSAANAVVGNYIYCETLYGDIDMYIIDGIISAVGLTLVCNVIYNEPGTPTLGQPSYGVAAICKYPDQPPAADSISEFLLNGIRNLNVKLLTNTYLDIVEDSASGTENEYTLNKTPTGMGDIAVFLNGVLQSSSIYTRVDKTITFTENVPARWRIAALYPVHPYE
ncbi:hypothetical protein ACFLQL_00025 [Verrucomicrobiota bacterium]